jgi:hypothetical protein
MMRTVALILCLMLSGAATALPLATYSESLDGQCNGTDSADGFDDSVAEVLGLDMATSHTSGNCQMVSNLLLAGFLQPTIDLQISSSAKSIDANWSAEGTGEGFISYYFQVTGPEQTFVDISVSAVISISGSRTGSASSTYSSAIGSVTGLPGGQSVYACSWFGVQIGCATGPEGGIEQSISYVTTVPANQSFLIEMQGTGRAQALGGAGTTESAEIQIIVDPIFSFVNSGDMALYTLEFSPNMTPVPLPATAALLPSGLLACAAWTRRRRTRS